MVTKRKIKYNMNNPTNNNNNNNKKQLAKTTEIKLFKACINT